MRINLLIHYIILFQIRQESIYKLKADAIVISINNFIDGKLSVESSVIYKLAGSDYARSFMNLVLGMINLIMYVMNIIQ